VINKFKYVSGSFFNYCFYCDFIPGISTKTVEGTAHESLTRFCVAIVKIYAEKYLQSPKNTEKILPNWRQLNLTCNITKASL
jgi:hypothetical protein